MARQPGLRLRAAAVLAGLALLLPFNAPVLQGRTGADELKTAIDKFSAAANGKITSDVGFTATAFVDAEVLWRSLRLVYLAETPLHLIENSISVISGMKDVAELANLKTKLAGLDSALGVAGAVTGVPRI